LINVIYITGKQNGIKTNTTGSHLVHNDANVNEIKQDIFINPSCTDPETLNSKQTQLLKSSHQIIERAQKTEFNNEKFKVEAMESASKRLSEYLRKKEKLEQPWILHHVGLLNGRTEETPSKHQFCFENNRDAAKFNTKLIKYTDYNLEKCIQKQKHSILSYGSEFRAVDNLKNFLQYHEDWSDIRHIIERGCDYRLEADPDEKTRLEDLNAMLSRGNHQSAKKNIALLQKAFDKEVKRGWLLPVTVESLTKIKNVSIIPLGIADQYSINEKGERIFKQRVTHDASFPAPSGRSVNNQVIEALLQDCIYGQCLRRIIHGIHNMRASNKNSKIYMTKYDMDAAYRRLHTSIHHSLKCVTVIDRMAYVPLRLPFGVSPGPSLYSTISECIYDAINDLLNEEKWDRDTLNSPYAPNLPDQDSYIPESTPIQNVRNLSVYIPNRTAFADGYIDDCLSITTDEGDNVKKSQEAPPLIINSIFRPIDKDDPISRDDNISAKKLAGEGQPSEKKVMLGWQIDTRQMRIFLPMDKAVDWSTNISSILKNNTVNQKQMETLVGRLNHVGHILPMGRYFLNRLRHLMARCEKYGKQQMQKWEREDLVFWLELLEHASNTGVSTNNLTYTEVTTNLVTDACEHGLGGLNLSTGKAWRYKLPSWMTACCHINLLEFLSCIIAIWLEIISNHNKENYNKYLALTDNSSAVGWLYKSNFNPKTQPGHDTAARKLASLLMESESSIESQHIRGDHNVVADSLSRDHHISTTHLTFILKSLYPSQTPPNFEISETLPNEITCWLDSLKGTLTSSVASTPRQYKSKIGALFDGDSSWRDVVSTTNTLNNSMKKPELTLSPRFLPVLEEMKMARALKSSSEAQPWQPPSITYVRPFGRTFGGTRL